MNMARQAWSTALVEHVKPALLSDGRLAVGFYQNHEMKFYVPVETREDMEKLVGSFQELFTSMVNRLMELQRMIEQIKPEGQSNGNGIQSAN